MIFPKYQINGAFPAKKISEAAMAKNNNANYL